MAVAFWLSPPLGSLTAPPQPQLPRTLFAPVDMADDAAVPDDDSIEYVTVVDIHAPERDSDVHVYKMRRNQKMKILFQGHAERNRHSNIHRFVFLLNGVRVTPECTIGSLDYNNSCDCLKLTPIEDWIRKSVQLVNARPIQSNDLELPRPSSRIDSHLHSLSIRNSLNVEQIRHARYTYRINSKWKNNWGFSFRSDSYYEEETILTTDRSVPQRISYVNYAQGHLTVEGSIFLDRQNFVRMISSKKQFAFVGLSTGMNIHPHTQILYGVCPWLKCMKRMKKIQMHLMKGMLIQLMKSRLPISLPDLEHTGYMLKVCLRQRYVLMIETHEWGSGGIGG